MSSLIRTVIQDLGELCDSYKYLIGEPWFSSESFVTIVTDSSTSSSSSKLSDRLVVVFVVVRRVHDKFGWNAPDDLQE